jgi:uncharacterized coiled-coil DUF342 family protein
MIEVHIYHHFAPRNLEEIMSKAFDGIKAKLDAANVSLDGKIAAVQAEVTSLSQQIAQLKASVDAGGLTPAEETQVEQSIDDLTTKMNALNPADPTTLPTPPAPVATP